MHQREGRLRAALARSTDEERHGPSGETIEGAWEKSDDGGDWEHDFRLIYRKAD